MSDQIEPTQADRDDLSRRIHDIAKEGSKRATEAIYRVLRDWRLSTMAQEDEPSEGYPLVDAVSSPGTDIGTGEEELGEIAYAVAEASERGLLATIGEMMSRHVENWPSPKRVSTALALIDKTLAAALGRQSEHARGLEDAILWHEQKIAQLIEYRDEQCAGEGAIQDHARTVAQARIQQCQLSLSAIRNLKDQPR